MEQQQKRDYMLPASILIAALLISLALVYNAGKKSGSEIAVNEENIPEEEVVPSPTRGASSPSKVKAVNENDHIFGDADAPVKVIEFSDLECPFCKRFHYTMKEAVKAYDGEVAWVYRHSPIDGLHSKARKEAEAIECAADLGGNVKFWEYVDRLMEVTPSNNGLDLAQLPVIAKYVGLDQKKFEACLASGKYANRVSDDLRDANESGGGGTPYSVVISPKGRYYVIPGALPFTNENPGGSSVKQIIDVALKN